MTQRSSEVVRFDGHVVDSLLLAKVFDAIVDAGALLPDRRARCRHHL
jgi:hypothetical protein